MIATPPCPPPQYQPLCPRKNQRQENESTHAHADSKAKRSNRSGAYSILRCAETASSFPPSQWFTRVWVCWEVFGKEARRRKQGLCRYATSGSCR